MIVAGDLAAVGPCVDNFRIGRIGSDVAAFAATDVVPIGSIDPALDAGAGDTYGGVVLLRAVDVIGEAVVDGDVVELRGRLIIFRRPGFRTVGRDGCAAVVSIDQAIGIGGIDPQAMIIAVRRVHRRECFSAVVRAIGRRVQDIDDIGGFRIGENVRVIPGPLAEAVIVGEQLPGFSAIVRAEDAAFFGLNHGPHAVGIGTGNRDADASLDAFGEAVLLYLLQRGAAVGRAIQTAARPAAIHAPWSPFGLP